MIIVFTAVVCIIYFIETQVKILLNCNQVSFLEEQPLFHLKWMVFDNFIYSHV